MKFPSVILVADRNPRIRDFIQRELRSLGYLVVTADNGEQLQDWIQHAGRLDMLIIDPDMPGMDNDAMLSHLLLVRPSLPVIFHCLSCDCISLRTPERRVRFVEKSGNSVDALKQEIWLLLPRHDDSQIREPHPIEH